MKVGKRGAINDRKKCLQCVVVFRVDSPSVPILKRPKVLSAHFMLRFPCRTKEKKGKRRKKRWRLLHSFIIMAAVGGMRNAYGYF